MANSSSFATKLATVVLVLVVLSAPLAESAVTCSQMLTAAAPCLPFLRNGGTVAPSCCNSLRSFYASVHNTPDLQASCNCIKSAAGPLGLSTPFMNQLPTKCAVNIPFTFSPNIDCTRIHFESK